MLWVPSVRVETTQLATLLPGLFGVAAVPAELVQVVIGVPESVKVTVPVGEASPLTPATVTVKVTVLVYTDGLSDDITCDTAGWNCFTARFGVVALETAVE